MVNLQSNIGEN